MIMIELGVMYTLNVGCIRDLDVTKAQAMLVSTLKWRHEFKVDEIANETFPEDVFGPVGRMFGTDKERRPITCAVIVINALFSDADLF